MGERVIQVLVAKPASRSQRRRLALSARGRHRRTAHVLQAHSRQRRFRAASHGRSRRLVSLGGGGRSLRRVPEAHSLHAASCLWVRRDRGDCMSVLARNGTSGSVRRFSSERFSFSSVFRATSAASESNATFWLFNHRLWLGALLALVGAGLFGAGLYVIHETLHLLFGITLSSRHGRIYLDRVPRFRGPGELPRFRAAKLRRPHHRVGRGATSPCAPWPRS